MINIKLTKEELEELVATLSYAVQDMNDEEDKHIINAYDKLYFALATHNES